MAREHKDIEDPNIHEPKGAGLASINETIVADGVGSTDFKRGYSSGTYNYNHSQSGGAITLTPVDTPIKILNDGGGANTILTFGLPGISDIWDTTDSQFDFTGLENGDTVLIRADFDIVTSANNTLITPSIELAIGSTPFSLNFPSGFFKTSGSYSNVIFEGKIFIGSDNTRANPAEYRLQSDAGSATALFNGFALTVIKRGVLYV